MRVPVGSGPYVIGDFEPGRHITFRRNPDYWGRDLPLNRGLYNFDTVRYDYFVDASVLFQAFMAGDLSVYRLLFQLEGNPELEAFCREALGPLLQYEGGGDLLETLEAFCERLGNLSQTAEKLFIHRNSLLYRMERISQIAGLDMNNPDTRLAVHLALKVRKMLNPPEKKKGPPGSKG